jgi:hypothetical protein
MAMKNKTKRGTKEAIVANPPQSPFKIKLWSNNGNEETAGSMTVA